jgi:acyl-coenzyme A thioesterase PaaI-like protein
MTKAFQDAYPDDVAWCYGCGRLNQHGLHVRSFWDGEETVARFTPRPYHTAIPGYVYGGLLASLVDCHATGSAAAAMARARGRDIAEFRFVTAALKVDFVAPTPIDAELEVRGTIRELKERKVVVACTVKARGLEVVRGEVTCVLLR